MDFGPGPVGDPLHYPGVPVPGSCLLIGSWIYPLEPPQRRTAGRNIGGWTIRGPARAWHATAGGDGDGAGPVPPGVRDLDLALSTVGATPMAGRQPLVAVGSNASPAQLRHKYRAGWPRTAIPIIRARLPGLAVAHSAHVSLPGYVPYVPVLDRTAPARTLHILWLDGEQLREMDRTEPNYVRVLLPAALVTAPGGPALPAALLPAVHAYRGRWGALLREPGGAILPATSQPGVYSSLARHAWFRALVPELGRDGVAAAIRALALDPGRRDRLRHELRARNLAADDRLGAGGAHPAAGSPGRNA